MTRRLIVFRDNNTFFVSQEFNGDKTEAEQFMLGCKISADWPQIPPLFDGVETLEQFSAAVQKAEALYGYEPLPLEEKDSLPIAGETWLMSHGSLLLATRYGDDMLDCLKRDVEEFGFKPVVKNTCHTYTYGMVQGPALTVRAKETCGQWTDWFTVIPNVQGHRFVSGNNTDQCNIWLYQTRPDLTPERCVEFFNTLNHTLGLFGEERINLQSWIDPEDWQEIAGIHDAYADPRYTQEES